MIDLENLSDQNFIDIVEIAKKEISHFSRDWTNLQESDPGMTLIDLFSWLKVRQHQYMNKILTPTQYKFLELLDIHVGHNRGSKTVVKLSDATRDIIIPKGTRFFAGDMQFESEDVESIIRANITGVNFINPDAMYNIDYKEFDSKRLFYVFGNEFSPRKKDKPRILQINLDSKIPNNSVFSLYFKVFMEEQYKRNPVRDSDNFFEMADVVWEFYGERRSVLGWHKIDVISDKTHNFLFSGIIKFLINGDMKFRDGHFSIRARLKDQYYDFPPRITNIFTNALEVSQRSTLCESNVIKVKDLSPLGEFSLSTHLSIYGESIVYAKNGESFEILDGFQITRSIRDSKSYFGIDDEITKRFKNVDPESEALIVVCYDPSISHMMVLGSGTSISSQRIDLKQRELLYDDFNIMVGYNKDNQVLYDKWEKVYDFFASNKFDKCYTLDINEGVVEFGDNEKGKAPRKAKDNIRLCSLALTHGKDSNIKSNMIRSLSSGNSDISKLKVEQVENAVGGCDAQTFDDVKSEAASILDNNKKAVTVEDYENIAKSTPGLIIKSIKVLPSYNPNKKSSKANCVTIVVRAAGDYNMNLRGYEENIKRHIDKFRLINTKVIVTGPVKIGLSISGDIVVNSYYRKSSNVISESISDFIDKINETCGNTLYYGEIFGMIDRLDCVSYVESLRIVPKGNYVEKTMADDIIIPANGVYYIESLDLNYIKSTNI